MRYFHIIGQFQFIQFGISSLKNAAMELAVEFDDFFKIPADLPNSSGLFYPAKVFYHVFPLLVIPKSTRTWFSAGILFSEFTLRLLCLFYNGGNSLNLHWTDLHKRVVEVFALIKTLYPKDLLLHLNRHVVSLDLLQAPKKLYVELDASLLLLMDGCHVKLGLTG